MKSIAQIEYQIHLCRKALHEMIIDKGFELTHPEVVGKSMELDQLILIMMHNQSKRFQSPEAS